MIEIEELEFPDWVIDKLASKHGVSVEECYQAFTEYEDRLAMWAKDKRPKYGDRLKVIGETRGGRKLIGYLYPTEEPARWRVNTAWEAD